MEQIKDYNIYLTKMSKTFFDKAWFISHIPEDITTIVDFGCADGSFLKFLKTNCPSLKYIGIDNDEKFKTLTKENGFECYESLKETYEEGMFDLDKTCLVLSSVIHEIYSYECDKQFWEDMKQFSPKYIAIRDMMLNKINGNYFFLSNEMRKNINKVFIDKYPVEYMKFVHNFGYENECFDETTITHFLLKYIYGKSENWDREVQEDYLPICINEMHRHINDLGYTIEFSDFYKLPYLMNRWKNDFETNKNYDLRKFIDGITTHYKMLLKRGE